MVTHRVSQRHNESVLDLLLHVGIPRQRVPPRSILSTPALHQNRRQQCHICRVRITRAIYLQQTHTPRTHPNKRFTSDSCRFQNSTTRPSERKQGSSPCMSLRVKNTHTVRNPETPSVGIAELFKAWSKSAKPGFLRESNKIYGR